MKLFFCNDCEDVVKLVVGHMRKCMCGKSSGQYKDDGINAILRGNCVPLGVANTSFALALYRRPIRGEGKEFTAFVIPEVCESVVHYRLVKGV